MFADPEDGGGGKSLCVGDLRRGSEWPKMCLLQTHKREERKKPPPSSLPHTPKWHTPTTRNKPQRGSSSHCLLGDHCTCHRSVVVRVTATATVHMTTAEEEMKEEWCFGSLMITFHCGKTKELPYWVVQVCFPLCAQRKKKLSRLEGFHTHDYWLQGCQWLGAAAHTNKKQETRTRSLKEAAACMKKSFVGSFFLSSQCFLEWWDCNVITLQVFLDFNFNRRIFHNKKECHGFPPPSRYLLHS